MRHRDALAPGLVVDHRRAEIVSIDAADAAEIRRQPDMDVGPGGLRRAFLEPVERLRHQLPSSLFSNSVERRPRSTMSNL